jgi:hypothetical protein
MNLWLLQRTDEPGWDEYLGFVICAETEDDARAWAATKKGDEGPQTWTDPSQSKIAFIGKPADGMVAGIVLESFQAG